MDIKVSYCIIAKITLRATVAKRTYVLLLLYKHEMLKVGIAYLYPADSISNPISKRIMYYRRSLPIYSIIILPHWKIYEDAKTIAYLYPAEPVIV